MKTRVSADNITAITASSAFSDSFTDIIPPTVNDLITLFHFSMDNKARELEQRAKSGSLTASFNKASAAIAMRRQAFDEIVNTVPKGFRLVPVHYTKTPPKLRSSMESEFRRIQPNFLKFIAQNHTQELRDLGICEHGIDRMKRGLSPTDEFNRRYDVSVDHIIERGGSGTWATSREPDEDNPIKKSPRKVSHFANLILLPHAVHEFKNRLNALQDISTSGSKWILMLVPERNDLYSGFVCPPGPPLAYIPTQVSDAEDKIKHVGDARKGAGAALRQIEENGALMSILAEFKAAAQRHNTIVPALFDEKDGAKIPTNDVRRLKNRFNAIVAAGAAIQKALDRGAALLDKFNGVVDSIERKMYNKSDTIAGGRAYQRFIEFYVGKKTQNVRSAAKNMPLKQALETVKLFKRIDGNIQTFRKRGNNKDNTF